MLVQVNCMSIDVDPETSMKAIRCLGTFARSLPSSCSCIVKHGALPVLCSRLTSGFEIIDIAEEAIRVGILSIAKQSLALVCEIQSLLESGC